VTYETQEEKKRTSDFLYSSLYF